MSAKEASAEQVQSFTDFEQSFELATARARTKTVVTSILFLAFALGSLGMIMYSLGSLNGHVDGVFGVESTVGTISEEKNTDTESVHSFETGGETTTPSVNNELEGTMSNQNTP